MAPGRRAETAFHPRASPQAPGGERVGRGPAGLSSRPAPGSMAEPQGRAHLEASVSRRSQSVAGRGAWRALLRASRTRGPPGRTQPVAVCTSGAPCKPSLWGPSLNRWECRDGDSRCGPGPGRLPQPQDWPDGNPRWPATSWRQGPGLGAPPHALCHSCHVLTSAELGRLFPSAGWYPRARGRRGGGSLHLPKAPTALCPRARSTR